MDERVRPLNDAPLGDGPVVYWMTSQRRLEWNHALDHAVARANELGKGLVVVEPLRADYPHACDRFHAFVQQGMQQHQQRAQAAGATYHPFIEPVPGAGKGMLAALADEASLVVADDHPGFFFPKMLAAAARLPRRMEAVDSVGILPMSCAPKPFTAAVHLRRFLQREMLPHLMDRPAEAPLEDAPAGDVPDALERWPATTNAPSLGGPAPVDAPGGRDEARARLEAFDTKRYLERNHPDAEAESGLSPYLHFGHIGAAEVVWHILDDEGWDPLRVGDAKGQRAGWWGLSEGAEAFLDQVITWRELGHIEARHNPDWTTYDSLPQFARDTLAAHEADREAPYDLATLESAGTDDALWNAAQRQLLGDGVIHNYMRMLWGKKILEWAPDSRTALDWMLLLNDRYALDGRDPNSVSGIMWCLGRYDRGWTERAVFGKVRCMTSDSARKKLRLDRYLARWA